MTNSPQEPGDRPDNVAAGGVPPYPGYQPYPSYPAYQPQPMPPPRRPKTGVIVTAVVALAAGIGIGVGAVALGSDDDPDRGSSPTSTPPITTEETTTTTFVDRPAEGAYSMESITNACDLVDPTLVQRWSSTPKGEPQHFETPPRLLTCGIGYSTLSTIDQNEYNEASVELEVEFTDGAADPAYDRWKRRDTDTTGTGIAFGDITGLGEQAYWFEEKSDTLKYGVSYVIGVLDSNVSVRTRISVYLAEAEPRPSREDMDAVARAEVQKALAGLRK